MAAPGKHRVTEVPRRLLRRATTVLATGALAGGALAVSAPMAQAYDPHVWDRVADCESSGDWDINTGNGYYGGLQFYQPTWIGFGGQEYASYAHRASKAEQIAIARRVLYTQGPNAWPVCSVEAGLTRSNGGADPDAEPGGGSDPAPDPGEEVTRYVSANTAANVRSGPGMGYRVVDTVDRGTEVSGVLQGGWLRIGEGRYVGPSVLSSSPVGGGSPAPDPGEVTRYVSASYAANVRSGPGMGYRVVDTVDRGSEVSGTFESGWLRIGSGRYIGPSVLSQNPV